MSLLSFVARHEIRIRLYRLLHLIKNNIRCNFPDL